MKISKKISLCFLIVSSLFTTGCEDFLTTNPTSSLPDAIVLQDLTTIKMLLEGTYRQMLEGGGDAMWNSPSGITLLSTGTGSDVVVNNTGELMDISMFSSGRYNSSTTRTAVLWGNTYKVINNANILISNIDNINGNETEKKEIKGQALTIRARCYFNLVRFYQHTYIIAKQKLGISLMLKPTIEPQARATVEEVYKQIIADLVEAENCLANYERPSKGRYNIDVVNFILANVYLTMNEWKKAEEYAHKIRTKYNLMSIDEYRGGFGDVNDEWVLGYELTSQYNWSLHTCWYDFGGTNSPWEAQLLYPSNYFVEVIMKEDKRMICHKNPKVEGKYEGLKFVEQTNSVPYNDLFDYRAAEMYLVEAESAARQGGAKLTLAKNILNTLQIKRESPVITEATDQKLLIDAILLERRKEFWGEGLDYFDVARLQLPIKKTIAEGHKGEVDVPANSNKLIMMIPDREIVNNKSLVQNPDPAQEPVFIP